MKEDSVYELIGKKLSGQCSETEVEELKAWLAEGENNQIIFLALQEHWRSENVPVPDKAKMLLRLYTRMNKPLQKADKGNNKPATKRSLIPRYFYPVAAVLLFCVCFIPWFVYNNLINKQPESAVIELVEKAVPFGQKSTIKLSDGSIVKLNSGSKLRYPSRFNGPSREVYLEGEAFFEVQKDTTRPFLVTSGDIVTSVLGTSFNIMAHSEENLIKVALVTGTVKVSHKSAGENPFVYTLAPNEMLTYDKKRDKPQKSHFNVDQTLAWKDRTLFFKNAGLVEMTTVLQRWYGKRFIIHNGEVITRKFSGKFESNRSLEYVLDVLCLNSNFTYQMVDDTVIIEGKP